MTYEQAKHKLVLLQCNSSRNRRNRKNSQAGRCEIVKFQFGNRRKFNDMKQLTHLCFAAFPGPTRSIPCKDDKWHQESQDGQRRPKPLKGIHSSSERGMRPRRRGKRCTSLARAKGNCCCNSCKRCSHQSSSWGRFRLYSGNSNRNADLNHGGKLPQISGGSRIRGLKRETRNLVLLAEQGTGG